MKRQIAIIELLRLQTYPTFEEIRQRLAEKGEHLSPRTIQRDLAKIRSELNVSIEYSKEKNGYYIDKETSLDLDRLFRFLRLASKANFIAESLRDVGQLMEMIDFDHPGETLGEGFLSPLLTATREQRQVFFQYKAFHAGTASPHNLRPYLLKEYMGRWYVIGYELHWKDLRTFAVDRIQSLEVRDEKFVAHQREEAMQRLSRVVGINYSEAEVQHVKIRFSRDQAKYELTRPWHASQGLLETCDNGDCIVKYFLAPNHEFKQRILMMGKEAEVLEPEWLREDMKIIIQRMAGIYKNSRQDN